MEKCALARQWPGWHAQDRRGVNLFFPGNGIRGYFVAGLLRPAGAFRDCRGRPSVAAANLNDKYLCDGLNPIS